MEKKTTKTIVLGVIASLIAAGIVTLITIANRPHICSIQIMSINEGEKVQIDSKTLQEKPNPDGILYCLRLSFPVLDSLDVKMFR